MPSHIDGDGDLHMYAAHSHSYIDGWMLYVHARIVSAGIHIFLLAYELQTMGVTFI